MPHAEQGSGTHLPVAYARVGSDGVVVEANEPLAQLLQRPHAKLVGAPASALFLDPHAYDDLVRDVRTSEAPWVTTLHLRPRGGVPLPAEVHATLAGGGALALVFIDLRNREWMERRFRALVENAADLIYIVDADGTIRYASPNVCTMFGYVSTSHEEINFFDFVHPDDRAEAAAALTAALEEPGRSIRFHGQVRDAAGRWHHVEVWGRNLIAEPAVGGIVLNVRDVTEQLAARKAVLDRERRLRALLETMPAVAYIYQDNRLVWASKAFLETLGLTLETLRQIDPFTLVHPDDRARLRTYAQALLRGEASPGLIRFRSVGRRGGLYWIQLSTKVVERNGRPAILGVGLDVSETVEHELDLAARERVARRLRDLDDLPTLLEAALEEIVATFGLEAGALLVYDPEHHQLDAAAKAGWIREREVDLTRDPPRPVAEALTRGRALHVQELQADPALEPHARERRLAGKGASFVPLLAGGEVVGVLVASYPSDRTLTTSEQARLEDLAELVGNAVRRTVLRAKLERRVRELEALRSVDEAIAQRSRLEHVLGLVTQQARLLPLAAVALYRYEVGSGALRLAASWGWPDAPTYVPAGEGPLGRAVPEGPSELREPELAGAPADARWMRTLPLVAKGERVGLLVALSRDPAGLGTEDAAFLESLAHQASVAIENARLIEALQQAKQELERAYDLTLAGWAQAVELRDRHTGDHTQRVVELTLKLARALGVDPAELDDLRRGALLHDVGKLAVPDAVLLKPGPLTAEEWAQMKEHPVHAYRWLSNIPYLERALNVPYAHHERWDGSGYPRGLRGEAIPLAARIFAVADVFDALTSDRPYRPAWPRQQALDYLAEHAGSLFDPRVVEAFLRLVERGEV